MTIRQSFNPFDAFILYGVTVVRRSGITVYEFRCTDPVEMDRHLNSLIPAIESDPSVVDVIQNDPVNLPACV